MVPVIVLSDGFLANGLGALAHPGSRHAARHRHHLSHEQEGFFPYLRRDPAHAGAAVVRPPPRHTGARAPHRRLGEAGRDGQHLVRPENHDQHGQDAREKVRRVGQEIPRPRSTVPPRERAGGRLGRHLRRHHGRRGARQADGKVGGSIHLRHLNPLPPDLGHILREYRKVLVPEINSGVVRVLRAIPRGRRRFNRVRACRWRAMKFTTPSSNWEQK